MIGFLLAACLWVFVCPLRGEGQERSWNIDKKRLQQEPIEIRARQLELRRKENLAFYTGDVLASQRDYSLKSQRLELRWDPETKKVASLIARGGVRLETVDGRVATAGEAVLDVASQSIVLSESPRMIQGGESVEGDRIIYSIAERKSTVLGGRGGQVKTWVMPGGKP
jgi:lipopolysaccharide export system protein LptA